MSAELTFTGSEYHGSPDPVTEVVVHLPAGVGGTSAGFPTCSEQTLDESGPAGCPAGSLAGPLGSIGLDIESGGVVIERVHETGSIQPVFADKENTNDDFFFYIEAPGVQAIAPAHYVEDAPPYGRPLKLELPLIESIPAQPFASITSLTLTLGASREEDGQLISSLTISQECPGSGMFPWAADVTYTTNASFTEQTHEHTTAETVCPVSSGKSATTTTLLASPASPHCGEVVSYTATVTPKVLGAAAPSGSVTFLDEGLLITGCTAQALIPGAGVSSASCQFSYSASGTHQIVARYGGDSGYFGSESAAQAFTVSAVEPPHEAPKETSAEPKPPAAYREATPTMRRQFNLAFFKRLLVGDDDTITAELAEPFDTILSDELRRAVITKAGDDLADAVDEALHQREADEHDSRNDERPQEPELASVGAVSAPGHSWRGGFSPAMMVRPSGPEPPRTKRSTRPSTGYAGCRWVRGCPDRPFCGG